MAELFKHVSMSEQEKAATIKAVEAACQRLANQAQGARRTAVYGVRKEVRHGYSIIHDFSLSLRLLSHWGDLVKGEIRSRNWRRGSRRFDVTLRAQRIARETGAEFEEVRELLCRLLPEYL
jgi:hypothetical protein